METNGQEISRSVSSNVPGDLAMDADLIHLVRVLQAVGCRPGLMPSVRSADLKANIAGTDLETPRPSITDVVMVHHRLYPSTRGGDAKKQDITDLNILLQQDAVRKEVNDQATVNICEQLPASDYVSAESPVAMSGTKICFTPYDYGSAVDDADNLEDLLLAPEASNHSYIDMDDAPMTPLHHEDAADGALAAFHDLSLGNAIDDTIVEGLSQVHITTLPSMYSALGQVRTEKSRRLRPVQPSSDREDSKLQLLVQTSKDSSKSGNRDVDDENIVIGSSPSGGSLLARFYAPDQKCDCIHHLVRNFASHRSPGHSNAQAHRGRGGVLVVTNNKEQSKFWEQSLRNYKRGVIAFCAYTSAIGERRKYGNARLCSVDVVITTLKVLTTFEVAVPIDSVRSDLPNSRETSVDSNGSWLSARRNHAEMTSMDSNVKQLSNLHLIDWDCVLFDSGVSKKDVRRNTAVAEALRDLHTSKAVFMFEEEENVNNDTYLRNFKNAPLSIKKYIT